MTGPLLSPAQLAQLHPRWRVHYRSDGHPKQTLTVDGAVQAKGRGLRTYRCPIGAATHAATNLGRRRRREARA